MKIQKKKNFFFFGGGRGYRGERSGSRGERSRGLGGGVGLGGQGGCERRTEVFVKILFFFFLGGGRGWVGGGGGGGGGQGGCESRIEVFGKFKKKMGGRGVHGGSWGVRMDVNEELKFL